MTWCNYSIYQWAFIKIMFTNPMSQIINPNNPKPHTPLTFGQVTSDCWIMIRAEAIRAPCLT